MRTASLFSISKLRRKPEINGALCRLSYSYGGKLTNWQSQRQIQKTNHNVRICEFPPIVFFCCGNRYYVYHINATYDQTYRCLPITICFGIFGLYTKQYYHNMSDDTNNDDRPTIDFFTLKLCRGCREVVSFLNKDGFCTYSDGCADNPSNRRFEKK